MPTLCRACLTQFDTGNRCPACHSPRITSHPELFDLSIAHMDCDAFYASVEKRDRPELADKPVIIGGGQRGGVSTEHLDATDEGAPVVELLVDQVRVAARGQRALAGDVAVVVEETDDLPEAELFQRSAHGLSLRIEQGGQRKDVDGGVEDHGLCRWAEADEKHRRQRVRN